MMNWQQLMSPTRFQIDEHGTISAVPPKAHTPYRTPFHTDYDRVVFPTPFAGWGAKPKCIRSPKTTTPTTALPTALKSPAWAQLGQSGG